MTKKEFTFPSADGRTDIHAVWWMPEGELRAVVQIAHGMQEYIERYEEFAGYLTGCGCLAAGHDHLGHGASVTGPERRGYFAEEKGAACILKDMHSLRRLTQEKYPELPYFMLGHSMGSFFLRAYLVNKGGGLSGALMIGTGYVPDAVLTAGLGLIRLLAARYGWEHRSLLAEKLVFSGARRRYDMTGERPSDSWLTKDREIVRAFYSDDRCLFRFTLNAYYYFLQAILFGNRRRNLEKIPKELPVFLASGADDPVGDMGKGVRRVKKRLEQAGLEHVVMKLYAGDRHEILNELDRRRVYGDIVSWLEASGEAGT